MYFTPDGKSAIVVAEALKRLDFRDPQTMALQSSIADAAVRRHQPRRFLDRRPLRDLHLRVPAAAWRRSTWSTARCIGYLKLSKGGMPQDIRVSPDGKLFYRRRHDGRRRVRRRRRRRSRKSASSTTGKGTHGLYPSRDGKKLYVTNRGSNKIHGPPHGKGSVSVLDFATRKVEANWPIPGGGSPDMGNVSADGKQLWLSGRYDNVVYAYRHRDRRGHDHPGRQGAARARRCGRSQAAIRSATPATCANLGQSAR